MKLITLTTRRMSRKGRDYYSMKLQFYNSNEKDKMPRRNNETHASVW
jgi:hypothetical protein